MFFVLSKILGFFAIPSNVAMAIGLVGICLLCTRFARTGIRLAAVGLVALAVMGWSPLGNALIIALEQRFPPWDESLGAPDGIVVLGGAISPDVSAARGQAALNESAERMTVVAALARRYPAARILFTGGSGSLVAGEAAEADFVLPLFESFGIARERVTLESRSRNTAENARFSKDLAQPKAGERWLLVTSAYHMPRAIGVFRKEGFAVGAYPVDWRTRGAQDVVMPFDRISRGLARTDTALHEWAGLLAYWLTAQSSELFPGPSTP
jgi:uncharacterized SAM-binding protein YcdF (DUF218 family)